MRMAEGRWLPEKCVHAHLHAENMQMHEGGRKWFWKLQNEILHQRNNHGGVNGQQGNRSVAEGQCLASGI